VLEARGCDHFKAFGTRGFDFPSFEEMSAPSKTVDTFTKIVLRKFWAESGREHAWKKAADRLAKVFPFNLTHFLIVFIDFECIVFLMHFFSHSFILARQNKLWSFVNTGLCMVRMLLLDPTDPIETVHRRPALKKAILQSPEPLLAKRPTSKGGM
jgi:hypothetical protein